MDTEKKIEEAVQKIEEKIYAYLPTVCGEQKTVIEAMHYSLKAGGKRIRPLLMLETYHLFSGEKETIYPFMAAMEMLHTYSLVHDDLPAMDNDLLRRGKPTCHAKYGEAMAILAGDALLNYAFETAFLAFDLEKDNDDIQKALQYFAKKTGVFGMIGGQVVDIETDNSGTVTKEQLQVIHKLKTGALLEASMVIPALLMNRSKEEIAIVESVAGDIGLAFQIQDDILDVISTQEILGKPVGSDEKNNKATYVTFEGLDKAKEDVEKLTKEALQMLHSLSCTNEFLEEILLYLMQRRY